MDEITSILQNYKNKSLDTKQDYIVLQPLKYISKTDGKHIPLKILRALNYWLDISSEKLSLIAELSDMLHSYLDKKKKILLLDHSEAIKVYTEEMQEMHRGQGMIDIYWRDNFKIPTFEEYKRMMMQKLGSLYNLVARLLQLFSTTKIDVSKLIVIIGMYLQILDDYHNLSEDITEGKFSFPIIHAIQKEENSGEILNILKQRTDDTEIIKRCISRMKALGSLQCTEDVLKSLDKAAREEVAKLGSNPLMDRLLNELRSPKAATD